MANYSLHGKTVPHHDFINPSDLDNLLVSKDLLGIIKYTDGKIKSPERLALEAILQGDSFGGRSFNYSVILVFKEDKG